MENTVEHNVKGTRKRRDCFCAVTPFSISSGSWLQDIPSLECAAQVNLEDNGAKIPVLGVGNFS